MTTEIEDPDVEFANAFNEDESAPAAGMGEEAVENVTGDEVAEAGEAEGAAVVAEGATPGTEGNAGAEGVAEMPTDDVEKERQRLRSWEGRLKAREAELAAKPAAPAAEDEQEEASDALEGVAQAADAKGSSELAQAANAAAEAVEAGEISPEDAMAQLSEDFGEEFIKMIKAIVVSTTKKQVEPVAKQVDDVVSTMNSKEAKAHFSAIASKHADFQEVGSSEGFKAYVQSLPDDVRSEAEQVAKAGTAEEVIALLDAYKAAGQSKSGPAQADTQDAEAPALEAMEGVRSAGVRLPEKPTVADGDYEGAWENF